MPTGVWINDRHLMPLRTTIGGIHPFITIRNTVCTHPSSRKSRLTVMHGCRRQETAHQNVPVCCINRELRAMPTHRMTLSVAFCACIRGGGKINPFLSSRDKVPPSVRTTVWVLWRVPLLCASARFVFFSFGLIVVSSEVSHGLQSLPLP